MQSFQVIVTAVTRTPKPSVQSGYQLAAQSILGKPLILQRSRAGLTTAIEPRACPGAAQLRHFERRSRGVAGTAPKRFRYSNSAFRIPGIA
jgi:hypothetical protein